MQKCLTRRRIHCIYGDVASLEGLSHAGIGHPGLIISTLQDSILKGTSNHRLLKQLRRLHPQAKIIVAAESIPKAVDLYAEGADYVFVPRLQSSRDLARIIEEGQRSGFERLREQHLAMLELAKRGDPVAGQRQFVGGAGRLTEGFFSSNLEFYYLLSSQPPDFLFCP